MQMSWSNTKMKPKKITRYLCLFFAKTLARAAYKIGSAVWFAVPPQPSAPYTNNRLNQPSRQFIPSTQLNMPSKSAAKAFVHDGVSQASSVLRIESSVLRVEVVKSF